MHYEYDLNGMNDFVCTLGNSFYIRDDKLISHYTMRSNDCLYGFCNDAQWAKYVQAMLAKDLDVEVGDLIWTASSLHVYEYHFVHIENLIKADE
jgi:thymidylate synthase